MENKKRPSAATETSADSSSSQCKTNVPKRTKPPRKIERVLKHLAAGNQFNRFEAEWRLSDHCLPSTISGIQRKYGIDVSREFETVPGYLGCPTRVCRYWLEKDQQERAREVLSNEQPK